VYRIKLILPVDRRDMCACLDRSGLGSGGGK
jgi:hypothetical protein